VPKPPDDDGGEIDELRRHLLAEIHRWAKFNPEACRLWLRDTSQPALDTARREPAD
jgi:hypothetical protein